MNLVKCTEKKTHTHSQLVQLAQKFICQTDAIKSIVSNTNNIYCIFFYFTKNCWYM